jgi:polyisoprenoid-binding protein YceI
MINRKYFQNMLSALLALALPAVSFSTGYNLNETGVKNFIVNDKVNPPQILFISTAPLMNINGSVNDDAITGTLILDPSNIEKATGNISVAVSGMETGIKTRNKHLYSPNWLDGASYPNIVFTLQKITDVKTVSTETAMNRSTISANAIGTISIHGKSKDIIVPISLTYIKESDETRKRAPGDFIHVTGKFDVSLKDYGITGIQDLIGTKVGETINIDLSLFLSSK